MRWFTSEEVCEILSRFEKVIIVGDSMMRHVIGSINVLIRKDLGYGAVTDWNFSPEERSVLFQLLMVTCANQPIDEIASAITSLMSRRAPSKEFSRPPMSSRTIWTVFLVQLARLIS